MYNPPNLPQRVSLNNMRPTAESLWNKLKKREARLRSVLEVNQDLAVELHAPSGSIIRIGEIGYYTDTDDALIIQGIDVLSGEFCQAIVPVQIFYVVFRIRTVEDPAQERRPIGFRALEDPEQPKL